MKLLHHHRHYTTPVFIRVSHTKQFAVGFLLLFLYSLFIHLARFIILWEMHHIKTNGRFWSDGACRDETYNFFILIFFFLMFGRKCRWWSVAWVPTHTQTVHTITRHSNKLVDCFFSLLSTFTCVCVCCRFGGRQDSNMIIFGLFACEQQKHNVKEASDHR